MFMFSHLRPRNRYVLGPVGCPLVPEQDGVPVSGLVITQVAGMQFAYGLPVKTVVESHASEEIEFDRDVDRQILVLVTENW